MCIKFECKIWVRCMKTWVQGLSGRGPSKSRKEGRIACSLRRSGSFGLWTCSHSLPIKLWYYQLYGQIKQTMAFLKENQRPRENHRLRPIAPGEPMQTSFVMRLIPWHSVSKPSLSPVSEGCFDAAWCNLDAVSLAICVPFVTTSVHKLIHRFLWSSLSFNSPRWGKTYGNSW